MASRFELPVAKTVDDLCKCAHANTDFETIEKSLMEHPEWFTQVPNGRKWGIIHQIVYHGNVDQLNRLLVLQTQNPNFYLLSETVDSETVTVLDIAREEKGRNDAMYQRIERLVAMDKLLNSAKQSRWEACHSTLNEMPDMINEKPPYRRFYFIHHIAYVGDQKAFDGFKQKYELDLNLLTIDDRSIVDVANGARHESFAQYVKGLKEKQQRRKSSEQFSPESRLLERAHVSDCITASTISESATTSVQKDGTPESIALTESNLTNFLTCPLSGKILEVPGRNDRIFCIEDCKQQIFFKLSRPTVIRMKKKIFCSIL